MATKFVQIIIIKFHFEEANKSKPTKSANNREQTVSCVI